MGRAIPEVKVLIDTHIWIWYLMENRRLPAAHKKLLQNPGTEVWLSSISIWEVCLLIENRKIAAKGSPQAWIRDALEQLPVREAPVSFKIAARSRSIALPHDDPAVRFIAATAAEMKLTLLTVDENLLDCKEITCR